MLITIDPTDRTAIYLQIIRQIKEQIHQGDITEGQRLPSAADLAKSLELNRNTVLQAYRELRDLGYLELRRGRGAIAHLPGALTDNNERTQALNTIAQIAREHGLSAAEIDRHLEMEAHSHAK